MHVLGGWKIGAQAAYVCSNCIHMRVLRIKQIASEEEKIRQLNDAVEGRRWQRMSVIKSSASIFDLFSNHTK